MFKLPELPYAQDALAPHISSETMALHYGKHHKGYVDTLNKLTADDPINNLSLITVIHQTHDVAALKKIFNNAAQSWNHDFFWKSMKPAGGGAATGDIAAHIDRDFGSYDAFVVAFNAAAAAHFGSGWLWLTFSDGMIEIMTTHDADLPLVHDRTALACCDLWEHAYYLDYHNRRADFVQVFLDHLINWDFVNANFAAIKEPAA
jgi:Fe-Mn family superoxide dismutase